MRHFPYRRRFSKLSGKTIEIRLVNARHCKHKRTVESITCDDYHKTSANYCCIASNLSLNLYNHAGMIHKSTICIDS